MKILHIAEAQNFTKPFFSLIENNFKHQDHAILSRGNINNWPAELKIKNNTLTGYKWIFTFLKDSKNAEKIILHGLWDFRLIFMLWLTPSVLEKCYWVIWGGDLYKYSLGTKNLKWHIAEFFRRSIISRFGHLVSYIPGDVELARKWYGATGKYHDCIVYTSNIYRQHQTSEKPKTTINIQIGNSADSTNNHFEILEKLKPFLNEDICIYAPLSYGNIDYAKKVISVATEIFGDKFKPLTEPLPFDEYLCFLNKIDVAVFNHKRQQAMGNTITLLGLGKKVYMRSDITPWQMFKSHEIKIFDIEHINLEKIPENHRDSNINAIKTKFSEATLLLGLGKIFN